MPEIDHSLQQSTAPRPTLPVSADVLLEQEIEQRTRFTGYGERISTGCGVLDGLIDVRDEKGRGKGDLGGRGSGVERGIVVGVSAGEGGEGILISLNLLASILLPHLSSPSPPPTLATIITPSTFPLPLLARVLKSRIRSFLAETALKNTTTGNFSVAGAEPDRKENEEIEKMVKRALEMVAISRVFEIEGLQEVLSEISSSTSTSTSGSKTPNTTAEIIDSQDSNNELSPVRSPARKREGCEDGIQMVLVDNMTSLITDLMNRKEKSEAHNNLTHLSRTLHTLTHTHNLLTVLHNSTTPSTHTSKTQHKSIFNDAASRPALGAVFAQFLDLHLFISSLPKTRRDAEVLYARDGTGEEVKRCCVVEVLRDECTSGDGEKYGGREEKWVPLEVGGDGTGFLGGFGEKRWMGMEREKMGMDVGGVAKVWGFGGRRV